MRYLQRKRTIVEDDITDMTEAVISEYVSINLRESAERAKQANQESSEGPKPELPVKEDSLPEAGYYRNYVCRPEPYGGVADYMIYCNHSKNFLPILYFRKGMNLAGAAAAALWTLKNRSHRPYGFALHTDGHRWQMIRIDHSMKLEKTCVYEAKNLFNKLYEDTYHQQLVLGLIE